MDALQVVENLELALLPPTGGSRLWVARTQGGMADELKLVGAGETPEEAIREVADQWEERLREEALLE